jgi:hypothetical protein
MNWLEILKQPMPSPLPPAPAPPPPLPPELAGEMQPPMDGMGMPPPPMGMQPPPPPPEPPTVNPTSEPEFPVDPEMIEDEEEETHQDVEKFCGIPERERRPDHPSDLPIPIPGMEEEKKDIEKWFELILQ